MPMLANAVSRNHPPNGGLFHSNFIQENLHMHEHFLLHWMIVIL